MDIECEPELENFVNGSVESSAEKKIRDKQGKNVIFFSFFLNLKNIFF
jgi:hypothetical protein